MIVKEGRRGLLFMQFGIQLTFYIIILLLFYATWIPGIHKWNPGFQLAQIYLKICKLDSKLHFSGFQKRGF